MEPDSQCLEAGQANFALNGLRGHFTQASVGHHLATDKTDIPLLNIDSFLAEHRLERIHLLHADIQGYELEMLQGAQNTLADGRVDFLFLSTHGESFHQRCRDHLTTHTAMRVILDVPPAASYSADGLIVAVRSGVDAPPLDVALRSTAASHAS